MQRFKSILHRWEPSGVFGRNVSLLAGGTAVGQAIVILASPILTRIYTTSDFGLLQAYTSILSFPIVIAALRYDWAALLPEQETTAATLVALALGIVLVMSLIFAGIAWWFANSSLSPRGEALWSYWWLLPIATCGAGAYQVLSQWSLRRKAYSSLAATKLTQGLSQVTIQLILGFFFQAGFLGLLLGDALGRMSGSLQLARVTLRETQKLFKTITFDKMREVALRYRHFPLVSSGSALINTSGLALPTLLLAYLYGPQVTGWFALTDRVMHVPSVLVGQAVSQVYCSEFARLAQADPAALSILFRRTARQLALLGLLPLLLTWFAAPPLFALVFGEPWREAGHYARLLALRHYAALIVSPLTPTLMLLEQQSWQLGSDICLLTFAAGGLWIGHGLGCSARQVIGIYGLAVAFSCGLHLWLSQRSINNYTLEANRKRFSMAGD